jgi:hypothetical protein
VEGIVEKNNWLGKKDSNLRMPESKSGALTNLATPHHYWHSSSSYFCPAFKPLAFFAPLYLFTLSLY